LVLKGKWFMLSGGNRFGLMVTSQKKKSFEVERIFINKSGKGNNGHNKVGQKTKEGSKRARVSLSN